ncbi:hypothetical protein NQ315_009353 [Exocentrus adspersus]|uniref:alpha-amylase n=1 Tax=Exocentrus adspersus TaxID=1586481 RepID=A0AAV8WG65_9CUCU|nr:hypothetical protein NQ315_009353 [Exocentrus adspersus]
MKAITLFCIISEFAILAHDQKNYVLRPRQSIIQPFEWKSDDIANKCKKCLVPNKRKRMENHEDVTKYVVDGINNSVNAGITDFKVDVSSNNKRSFDEENSYGKITHLNTGQGSEVNTRLGLYQEHRHLETLPHKNNNFAPGRNTIVHLFEWKWDDIADECQHFLGPKGYAGVQISPPNENQIITTQPYRPWWERYQPVSYKLNTRSGDESSLALMIRTCNAAGVRIYADVVFNHMAAVGGKGTDGTNCNPNKKYYPGVPYHFHNFHKSCAVNNYNDAENVRNCEIVHLRDLDQSQEYVRQTIVQYLDHLVSLGVAGFRVDAAKHMWPSDLGVIYSRVNDLSTDHGFPKRTRPFFYQEVIDLGGEAVSKYEYIGLGAVLEFKFGAELSKAFQGNNPLKYLKNWGPEWGLLDAKDAVAFIDNHDNQRSSSHAILTYKKPKYYKMAIAFMLAHPYGTTKIMSSFAFDSFDQGPPNRNGNIVGPGTNKNGSCTNGWVCEHRWHQIYNMVEFRNVVEGTIITNWWDNNNNQIAFGRGDKGFVAFTLNGDIKQPLKTSLQSGIYCDVISGDLKDGRCSGKTVEVDDKGYAGITLYENEEEGVVAIHVNARILAVAAVAQKNNNFQPGRNTIVHLFEWKWSDIASECENFLAPKGYAGVQISPPNENEVIVQDGGRPWWERYQPVSYELTTRSGDESALADMISRCNAVGVKIYVDAVFNHMAAIGGTGTGGHDCDPGSKSYPAVPYGSGDFHTSCAINNYNDAGNVRNCELEGLPDLDQSKDYVRQQIVGFLNHCVDLGVAGFRVDAAKHMSPADLEAIYGAVKDLPSGGRPFFYQEVIDFGGEAISKDEYTGFGTVLEFKYGTELGNAFQGNNPLKYLKNWGPEWGLLDGMDAVAFIDNHDNQRTGSSSILTYKNSKPYKMAIAFMLAHPYGTTRIMSSYAFDNKDQGPPSDGSGNIVGASINADGTCGNGWVCEHRWREIYNMVGFRNAVAGTDVTNWWDNNGNQIAFGRGNKGFIAFALEGDIKQSLPTSLPAGTYCDVISGGLEGGSCTGKSVTVDDSGNASITLSSGEYDGVIAIHVNAKL